MLKSLKISLINIKLEITKSFMVSKMATTTNNNQQILTSECLICGAELTFNSNLELGELLECYDCGTELEVESVSPLILIEAPSEGEDWGE
jgi:alpha-aminoadipate carrier protein LysW